MKRLRILVGSARRARTRGSRPMARGRALRARAGLLALACCLGAGVSAVAAESELEHEVVAERSTSESEADEGRELPAVTAPAPATSKPELLPPLPGAFDGVARPERCGEIVQIEIRKYERRLRATCADGQVLDFDVALGRRPFGDKQRQGDLRTPEGYYRVAEPARSSQFHVFIALDYPSVVDADQALNRGDIDSRTYLDIVRATLQGKLPPQDTSLGGAIGIHGEGEGRQGRSRDSDWTLGCIALSDRNARFIGERVAVGTPVIIRP